MSYSWKLINIALVWVLIQFVPAKADMPLPNLSEAAPAAAAATQSRDEHITFPESLPGEQLTHERVPFNQQFAPPLPGPDNSIYVFVEPDRWQVWPLDEGRVKWQPIRDFQVPSGTRLGYSAGGKARYSSVTTPKGNWLIGPTVELIQPDGSRYTGRLKWPRNNVKPLVLSDGSILAVGGYSWPESQDFSYTVKVERIWFDAGNRIRTEELPPIPVDLKGTGVWESLDGYSVVLTGNGQVLLAGSEYRNLSLLFDPVKRRWRKLPGMPRARTNPALILLPDGRVWATGGKGWGAAETTTDLWEPKTQTWTLGPDLPIPMVNHQAVLNEKQDVVLLAGGYYPTVLGWGMGSDGVFVAAQHSMQRRGAGVFAFPGQRLILTGGRHARGGNGEAWGRDTPGTTVLSIDSDMVDMRQPVWPTTHAGALLENGGQLLAIGGFLHHNHNGSEENSGTRLIERIDLSKGKTHTLAPLPLTAGRTQAARVGGQEVLIHAENVGSEKEPGQWLGILNTQTGVQRALPLPRNPTYSMSDGIHRRMHLVGAHAERGWLIAEDGEALRVSSKPPYYEPSIRMQRQRQDFSGRVLTDGRVVVAGGVVESELVASRPANCEDCPVRYIGFGPMLPSRRHEIYDPKTSNWNNSAPSRASGGPVGIFADGRVAKLGESSPLLEISDPAGKTWRTLPLPPNLPNSSSQTTAYLHTVVNDSSYLARALFVGVWRGEAIEWWWLDDVDSPTPSWKSLGKSAPPYAFPPGEQDSGYKNSNNQRIVFVGGDAGVVSYIRP